VPQHLGLVLALVVNPGGTPAEELAAGQELLVDFQTAAEAQIGVFGVR